MKRKEECIHRKIFSLIAMLMLVMIMSTTPRKVEAQSLVEFAIGMMSGVRVDREELEIYYGPHNPSNPNSEDPVVSFNFKLELGGISGLHATERCTQTVTTSVSLHPVVNHLKSKATTDIDGNVWFKVGEDEFQLKDCFKRDNRIVMAVSTPVPQEVAERIIVNDSSAVPSGLSSIKVKIFGYSILDLNGNTVAAATVSERDYSVIVTRNADF
jgi:hypothetical protein